MSESDSDDRDDADRKDSVLTLRGSSAANMVAQVQARLRQDASRRRPAAAAAAASSSSAARIGLGRVGTAKPLHGFPRELFVDKDKIEDFICAICTDVCRDAVETPCTHIFCASCLNTALAIKSECPLDHRELQSGAVRVAGFVRRKVLDLDVMCPYNARGCAFVGNLSSIAKHKTSCPCAIVTCLNCHEEMQAKDAQIHRLEMCCRREVSCIHCSNPIPVEEMKEHHGDECEVIELECPNGCGASPVRRAQLKVHLSDICPREALQCRYFENGCTELISRSDMKEHMLNAQRHLELVESDMARRVADARSEAARLIRFSMRVGTRDQYLELVTGLSKGASEEDISITLQGMQLYVDDVAVQERGCRSLLTLCEVETKQADRVISTIADHGGFEIVMEAMKVNEAHVKVHEYGLHVMRKMATNEKVKLFVQDGNLDYIDSILDIMRRYAANLVIQRDAVGVLLNMAVNDTIEVAIGRRGGIRAILVAMAAFADRASLNQLACHAIFHLTFDDGNKERLVRSGALPRLLTALKTHIGHTNTVYYSLRAIAQLAKADDYRDKMRRLGIVRVARYALANHPSHKDLKKKVKMLIARLASSNSGTN